MNTLKVEKVNQIITKFKTSDLYNFSPFTFGEIEMKYDFENNLLIFEGKRYFERDDEKFLKVYLFMSFSLDTLLLFDCEYIYSHKNE